MGIFAKTIFVLFHVVANFNDFHPRKTSVGNAHIPKWYFLLFFRPENTSWHFSESILRRSKCYKLQGFIHTASTPLFAFFRDFNEFRLRKVSVGQAHLPNQYYLLCFCPENTAWHFFEPNLRRSKCYKALFTLLRDTYSTEIPFFVIFCYYKDFYLHKSSVGEAHLPVGGFWCLATEPEFWFLVYGY